MPALIELLRDATAVKKFLDELEKNPGRTLLAVAAVLLLTGAGVQAVMASVNPSPNPTRLSELPTDPARFAPDGTLLALPEPRQANDALELTLAQNRERSASVEATLHSREPEAPVTEREIQILNESGKVTY